MKLTKARRSFLSEMERDQFVHATESYPPLKWALEQGFCRKVQGRYSDRYVITPEGRAVLARALTEENGHGG